MVLAHNINEGQRTSDVKISVDVTFESMLLANKTLEGLKNSGFLKPSPIQLHGIPLGKCGFDLLLEAKSGTGKTAVFTVIALEKLDLHIGLQTIILAPTREIAAQISDVIKSIGSSYKGLNVEVVMGGLPIEEDILKFRKKVHVLVGSPGRMRHLIHEKHVDISAVRLLILDEADKLMHKSFQADINYIFSVLPKQKQVIMSSATYPDTLKSIMQNYVLKAQHVCPDSTSILLGIKQFVTVVKCNINIVRQTQNKFEELLKILSKREFKQCLIFCNYQVRVGELCKMLMREKWPAEQLHGQLEQTDRLDALKTLQEYKCRILVSTDLAARGIDASNVDLVINFEPPNEWQTYLHRIGRAGRFGSFGIAVTILSEGKEQCRFKEMIKGMKSLLKLNYLWDNNKFELDDFDTKNDLIDKEKCNSLEGVEISDLSVIEKECLSSAVTDGNKTKNVENECIQPEGKKVGNASTLKLVHETPKAEQVHKLTEEEIMCQITEIQQACQPLEAGDHAQTHSAQLKLSSENIEIHKNDYEYSDENIKNNKYKYIDTPETNKDQVQEHHKELTKTSERKNTQNNGGTYCLAKLFDTFKQSKLCKVESFNDLIADFESYVPVNNDNINIEDVSIRNYLNSILMEGIESNILLESNIDLELEKHIQIENMEAKTTDLTGHKSENSFEKIIRINSQVNNHKQLSEDRDGCLAKLDSCSLKALENAGLPTSFGSKKYCNKNTTNKKYPQNHSVNATKNLESNVSRYENVKEKKCKQTTKKILKEIHSKNSCEMSSISFNDDGYNTQSYQNTKIASCGKVSKTSIENNNGYENYIIWYKQLKTHIKQVEMTLYIDELSRV